MFSWVIIACDSVTGLGQEVHSDFQQIEGLKRLAQDAYDEDRMASAVVLLQCYLEYFPDDGKAWFNYGDALRVLGRKGEAAIALAKAEKMCPPQHAWTVHARLGMLFQDGGDRSAAERWFTRALEDEGRNKKVGCGFFADQIMRCRSCLTKRKVAIVKRSP